MSGVLIALMPFLLYMLTGLDTLKLVGLVCALCLLVRNLYRAP